MNCSCRLTASISAVFASLRRAFWVWLRYAGYATAARIPTMATTTAISTSVKPRPLRAIEDIRSAELTQYSWLYQ
jgi:hypothetical protein